MFARLATLVLLVVPALAVPTGAPSGVCTTGEIMCCNSSSNINPSNAGSVAGILTGLIGAIGIPLNVQCNPISVLTGSGQSCSSHVACCSHNTVNALISLECTPVDISL